MPSNYVLLRKVTLTATASSVTFSNIPQSGYTDLKIVMSTRDARTGVDVADILFNFNGDGVGSGISGRYVYGTGSSVATSATTDALAWGGAAASTTHAFGSSEVYIPNYLSTNTYTSIISDSVSENNAIGGFQLVLSGLWSSNSAIHTIAMTPFSSPFATNSTFSLYGLAAVGTTPAISPFATGGDSVTTDGTYWYHTFSSSGIFAPAKALTCDYLVVAGGGGGGSYGGGGGAGGLRSTVTATGGSGSLESALSLTTGNYAVYVGAGGTGGTSSGAQSGSKKGFAGSDSIFATITSLGGGSGLGFNENTSALANGGSGGGGIDSPGSGQYINGGTGQSNQGFAGGRGFRTNAGWNGGGGGGGAGSAGSDGAGSGSSPIAGAGGSGRSIAISGSSVTYASGGAGMAEAGSDAAGASGTASTGNGGGSGTGVGTNRLAGGNGGSGIVIVRYPIA
jgi:hypothetical protein